MTSTRHPRCTVGAAATGGAGMELLGLYTFAESSASACIVASDGGPTMARTASCESTATCYRGVGHGSGHIRRAVLTVGSIASCTLLGVALPWRRVG